MVDDQDPGQREIKVFTRPVTGNYLSVMGIRPYLGRLLAPGDDDSSAPVAVMTWSSWKRLGADPNIVGRKIGGQTIVGVTPEEFTGSFYGLNGDLLTSLGRQEDETAWRTHRDARRLFLIARLKPGVTRRQAQAEMGALSGQLARVNGANGTGRSRARNA